MLLVALKLLKYEIFIFILTHTQTNTHMNTQRRLSDDFSFGVHLK